MWNQGINRSTCVRAEDVHDRIQPPGNFHDFIMRVRHKVNKVPFLLLLMVITSFFHASHCVWSFSSFPHQVYLLGIDHFEICKQNGMSKSQTILCEKKGLLDEMSSFAHGAKLATDECKFQFQYNRWNCSIPKLHEDNLFWRVQNQDTREAAFTYALTSAGVVWALARACANNNLSQYCKCSKESKPSTLKNEYLWSGCGDNINYGLNLTKLFVDAEEYDNMRYTDPSDTVSKKRVVMNMHNNNLGRTVVKDLSFIECKCHGVSGSCNLKTCWRQLSEFREIGNRLHDKYDSAVHVVSRRQQGVLTLLPKKMARSYSKRQALENTAVDPTKMIYLNPSPNFCIKSEHKGILGTKGRKCIKDSPSTDGCSLLCCDRGYKSQMVTVTKRCKCKFYWCCEVKCRDCTSRVNEHTCK